MEKYIVDQIIENLISSGRAEKHYDAYAYLAGMAFAVLTDEQKNEILSISEKWADR